MTGRLVLCDSAGALDLARDRLPSEATVLTGSPHLALTGRARAIDAGLPASAADRLVDALGAAGLMAAEAAPDGLGVALARLLAVSQSWLYWALCLDESLFAAPLTIVAVDLADSGRQAYYGMPWATLLRDHPAVEAVTIDGRALPPPPARQVVPPLRVRLTYSSWRNLAYRALRKAGGRLPGWGGRPTVLVARENELVKEIAVSCAQRGARLRGLSPAAAPDPADDPARAAAADAALTAFDRHVAPLLPPPVRPAARDHLRDEVKRGLAYMARQEARWAAALAAEPAVVDGRAVVLSNHIGGVDGVALFRAARVAGVPCLLAEHGVTAEIDTYSRRLPALLESAVADHVFCFDPANAAVQTASPLAAGGASAIGASLDNRRAGRLPGGGGGAAPVWYVSTFLTKGATGVLNVGGHDTDRARRELALAETVLARLPHRVFYKPYPGNRTLDPDPVTARLADLPGLTVYADHLDLRYLVADAGLLVTGRSSSTIGWCLLSGRPTVFIDWPDQAPLEAEARAAMEAGLFLFDAGAADFHDRLRAFLSQDLDAIRAQWAARADARRRLIARFFDGTGDGPRKGIAGAVAARYIFETFGPRRGIRQP